MQHKGSKVFHNIIHHNKKSTSASRSTSANYVQNYKAHSILIPQKTTIAPFFGLVCTIASSIINQITNVPSLQRYPLRRTNAHRCALPISETTNFIVKIRKIIRKIASRSLRMLSFSYYLQPVSRLVVLPGLEPGFKV